MYIVLIACTDTCASEYQAVYKKCWNSRSFGGKVLSIFWNQNVVIKVRFFHSKLMVIFIHHNNGSSNKKNIEYELNINLNYHISSHIMTKLNRLHLTTFISSCTSK